MGAEVKPAAARKEITLAELERLEREASPAPWDAYSATCCPDMGGISGPGRTVCAVSELDGHAMNIEDAELAAAARNALPGLLAKARAASMMLAALEAHGDKDEHLAGGFCDSFHGNACTCGRDRDAAAINTARAAGIEPAK